MPICKRCDKKFPNTIVINGKRHNVSKRVFCLECSPFGKHNTRKDLDAPRKKRGDSADVKRWRHRTMARAIEYKGGKCVVCGYNRCSRALDFHHVDPSTKLFTISNNGFGRSWERVKAEIDKCVLLCANCHRELHAGLISLPEP